jgi:hypothetical protein
VGVQPDRPGGRDRDAGATGTEVVEVHLTHLLVDAHLHLQPSSAIAQLVRGDGHSTL